MRSTRPSPAPALRRVRSSCRIRFSSVIQALDRTSTKRTPPATDRARVTAAIRSPTTSGHRSSTSWRATSWWMPRLRRRPPRTSSTFPIPRSPPGRRPGPPRSPPRPPSPPCVAVRFSRIVTPAWMRPPRIRHRGSRSCRNRTSASFGAVRMTCPAAVRSSRPSTRSERAASSSAKTSSRSRRAGRPLRRSTVSASRMRRARAAVRFCPPEPYSRRSRPPRGAAPPGPARAQAEFVPVGAHQGHAPATLLLPPLPRASLSRASQGLASPPRVRLPPGLRHRSSLHARAAPARRAHGPRSRGAPPGIPGR
jgi:hypothetical protein